MTEEEEYELAERLAESMGMELRAIPEIARIDLRIGLYEKNSSVHIGGFWRRRNEPLRGNGDWRGMLDIGTDWTLKPKRLPPGITKDSTDEEIDLTLSVMGF